MISRLGKILYLVMILSATVIFSGPAEAAYSPDFCKKLDMLKVAQEMMNQADSGTYSSSETAMLAVGDMYNTAWPVTCFVGYGLHNFEEAVEFLTKEENLNKVISRATKGADTPSGANMEIMLTTTNDLVDAIKSQGLLEGTVYNRAQMAGFILLIVFFIGSLTYYVAQIFLGTDEANPLDIMFLFIRFATLAIILAFLRPMIFLGLEASTLLRGSLVNTPVTVVAGLGQTASSKYWNKGDKVYNPWLKGVTEVTGGFGIMDTITNADGSTRSRSSGHKGVDFRAKTPTQIYAPVDGYMTCKGSNSESGGLYIEITEKVKGGRLEYPFRHRALHLSSFDNPNCNSSKPIPVTKGEPIGKTGNTGQYTGKNKQKVGYAYHLHVDVYDPQKKDFVHPIVGLDSAHREDYLNPSTSNEEIWDPKLMGQQTGVGDPSAYQPINYGLTAQTSGAGTARSGTDSLTLDMLYNQMMDIKLNAAYAGRYDIEGNDNRDGGLLSTAASLVKDRTDAVKNMWKEFWTGIVVMIARLIARCVIYFMLVVADVMAAITLCLGPIVIALSILPTCQDYFQHWLKSFITLLFYQPLAGCFSLLMFVLMAVSFDCGVWYFILMCVVYVYGCIHIPDIADSMSGTALVGIATTMAMLPAAATLKASQGAMNMGLSMAGTMVGGPAGFAAAQAGKLGVNAVSNVAGQAGESAGSATGGQNNGGGSGANTGRSRNTGQGYVRCALLPIVVLLSLLFAAAAFANSSANLELPEKTDADLYHEAVNVMAETHYPSEELYEAVKQHFSKSEKSAFVTVKEGDTTLTQGREEIAKDPSGATIYVDKSDPDSTGMTNGIYNTAYTNAISLPVTRFILGNSHLDATRLVDMACYAKLGKGLDAATGSEIYDKFNMRKEQMEAAGTNTTNLLNEVQNTIYYNIMYSVPIAVLVIMLLVQLLYVTYADFAVPSLAGRISFAPFFPRFFIFALLIVYFRSWAGFLITFSNYLTCAILPLEAQTELIDALNVKTGIMAAGAGANIFSSWLASFLRTLTLLALKILLIARDIFLAISMIVGPLCLALGFFSRMQQCDPIHQFFSGWLEGFIKLLLWGPLAALMIWCLSIVSILTSMDIMSLAGVAITSLAFLKAAGNLPSLADKMSGLMLASLLTTLAPAILSSARHSGMMLGHFGGRLVGAKAGLAGGAAGGLLGTLGNFARGTVGGSGPGGGGWNDNSNYKDEAAEKYNRRTDTPNPEPNNTGTGDGAGTSSPNGTGGAGGTAGGAGGAAGTGSDKSYMGHAFGEGLDKALSTNESARMLEQALYGGSTSMKGFGARMGDKNVLSRIANSLGIDPNRSKQFSQANAMLLGLLAARTSLLDNKASKTAEGKLLLDELNENILNVNSALRMHEDMEQMPNVAPEARLAIADRLNEATTGCATVFARFDAINDRLEEKKPTFKDMFIKSAKTGLIELSHSDDLAQKLSRDEGGQKVHLNKDSRGNQF